MKDRLWPYMVHCHRNEIRNILKLNIRGSLHRCINFGSDNKQSSMSDKKYMMTVSFMCFQARPSGAQTASCVPNRLPNPARCRWLGCLAPPAFSRWFSPPAPPTSQTPPPWTPHVWKLLVLQGGVEVTLLFMKCIHMNCYLK